MERRTCRQTDAQPNEQTHPRLRPRTHQLIALCQIFDRYYATHPLCVGHRHTYLADDIGVGKTLSFILCIAIRDYHERKIKESPDWRSACMDPFKIQFVEPGKEEEAKSVDKG